MKDDVVQRYNDLKERISVYEDRRAELNGKRKVYIGMLKDLGYAKLSDAVTALNEMNDRVIKLRKQLEDKLTCIEKQLEELENV